MKYLLFIYDRYDCPGILSALVDDFPEIEAVEQYLINNTGERYHGKEAEVLVLTDANELEPGPSYEYNFRLAQWKNEAAG